MRGLRTDPERMEVRMLLRHTPLRGARVLDVGCGDGRLTRRIAAAARGIVGIDPDQERIALAKRWLPAAYKRKVRFDVGAAETLRFPDQSFDFVLFSWSL